MTERQFRAAWLAIVLTGCITSSASELRHVRRGIDRRCPEGPGVGSTAVPPDSWSASGLLEPESTGARQRVYETPAGGPRTTWCEYTASVWEKQKRAIWRDEEPPHDVYDEQRRKLIESERVQLAELRAKSEHARLATFVSAAAPSEVGTAARYDPETKNDAAALAESFASTSVDQTIGSSTPLRLAPGQSTPASATLSAGMFRDFTTQCAVDDVHHDRLKDGRERMLCTARSSEPTFVVELIGPPGALERAVLLVFVGGKASTVATQGILMGVRFWASAAGSADGRFAPPTGWFASLADRSWSFARGGLEFGSDPNPPLGALLFTADVPQTR